MKPREPWHDTLFGRTCLFLGSVRLAVPVLAFVAVAMAWGTYLESTQSSKVSRAVVYGSWWFIGLMALVCVSLVFAVITRYPWKRKHVGFITVHAGLIVLIVGGFSSMFGRVEGHLSLEEGSVGEAIEVDEDVFELVEFNAGNSTPVGVVPAPAGPATLNIGGMNLTVAEVWNNTIQEEFVANDNPRPFRAIEIAADAGATQSDWIGQADAAATPAIVHGLQVRVLPDGTDWQPPAAPEKSESGFAFLVGTQRFPLAEEGKEAFPGWTIKSLRRFKQATVTSAGIAESATPGEDNPAVDVTITDGKGTTERHTAFVKFPDMIMSKRIEGSADSGAKFRASGSTSSAESLVVFGPAADPRFGYVPADAAGRVLETPKSFPAAFDLGGRRITILNHFTNARPSSRFLKGPEAKERRPAVVLRTTDGAATVVVPWKEPTPIPASAGSGGRNILARYGPRMVPLPFTVRLKDFRKRDYPGTEMAMAYESDVLITRPGEADLEYNIYMNNPYKHAPWKVYQSGFIGDNISVFSVMKDPGIPLTYLGSIILCVGIYLTFFSRSLSWGHPGIPAPFEHKESKNAPSAEPASPAAVTRAVAVDDPVGAGV
jgi:hypothetical protein